MREGAELVGDTTGRVWRFHPGRMIGPDRWQGTAVDDGSHAMVVCRQKGGRWQEDVDRMRHAVELARLPEVDASSTIRRFLDLRESEDTVMDFGGGEETIHGHLWTVWEWADLSLHDFLAAPDGDLGEVTEQVETNVRDALNVLHAIGFVHCDVAPNNILRVESVWKLADLDACRMQGELSDRHPGDECYLHPERRSEPIAAREEFDWFGLEAILNVLRG